MATQTENYKLNKPDRKDNVDIDLLNENFDKIDQNLKPPIFVTITANDDGTYSADLPYDQVCEAIEKGYAAVAVFGSLFANLSYYMKDKGIMFTAAYPPVLNSAEDYELGVYTYALSSDNSVVVRQDKCYFLPAAPSAENWTFTLEDGSTVTKAVFVG